MSRPRDAMKMPILLALVVICVGMAARASAQDQGLAKAQKQFAGTYVSKRGVKAERKSINKRIEKLVGDMVFFKRPFARSALKDSTTPCPKLIVLFSADKMAINCKGRVHAESPRNGHSVRWVNHDGDEFRLSQKLEKNRMVQVFRGDDGTRTNIYTLKNGGKELHIQVTITSDSLPRPLKYTRVLRRN